MLIKEVQTALELVSTQDGGQLPHCSIRLTCKNMHIFNALIQPVDH